MHCTGQTHFPGVFFQEITFQLKVENMIQLNLRKKAETSKFSSN